MAIKVQEEGGGARKTGLQTTRLDKPGLEMIDEIYKDERAEITNAAMVAAGFAANHIEFRVGRSKVRQLVSYGPAEGRKMDEDGRVAEFGPGEVQPCWHPITANVDIIKAKGYVPVLVKQENGKDGPVRHGDSQLWMRSAQRNLRLQNAAAMESWTTLQGIPQERGQPAAAKYQSEVGSVVAV